MLPNSKLLDAVLKKANEILEQSGHKKLNSNYVVLALILLMQEEGFPHIPDAESDQALQQEMQAVAEILNKHIVLTPEESVAKLQEVVKLDPMHADTLIYSSAAFNAEMQANREKRGAITADIFFGNIFEKPTDALMILMGKDPSEKPHTTSTAASEEGEEDADVFARYQKRKGKSSGTSKTPVQDTDALHSATGVERIALLVERAKQIQTNLLDTIFGQDHAVNSFVSGYFQAELTSYISKNATKPMATFLFAGPPGVGKTFLAEQAAEQLGFPFQRFDMSEYSDKEANLEFCGSDKVYKNAKEGNVTGFVRENPRCVLLFDEVEKAHMNIIHLFLQMLDAGRLRDNFTDEEVSFADAIVIFTTNAGKSLYEDSAEVNLSGVSRKQIIKALSTDINPVTYAPLFPTAICSRFASGNVIMFNHLSAHYLQTIVSRTLQKNIDALHKSTDIMVTLDGKVPSALMLAEGGKADARTVTGRANSFFHQELYELLRLMNAEGEGIQKLEDIQVRINLPKDNYDIRSLFVNSKKPEILLFSTPDVAARCSDVSEDIVIHFTDDMDVAKEILFNHDITIILCDVRCKPVAEEDVPNKLLNLEDINSVGRDFMEMVVAGYDIPLYILELAENDISGEEFISFARMGARGKVTAPLADAVAFEDQILEKCSIAYQQNNLTRLAKTNRILAFKTAQRISPDGKTAEIVLFDFALSLATDTEEAQSILSNVMKPNVRFSDVIGAADAKSELGYFVQYLKDPVSYMRKGVRAPKGVLLWGPPGTGKTLLAKAMAGESDVTFLVAEGNQFLKKWVGEGPAAIHTLFKTARKFAPAIVFIDEIDAIGKDRSSAGSDVTSDVLTALLTEMDGFKQDTTKPVFVLAATNYGVEQETHRRLDPALVRRFDRRIFVDLPKRDERKEYILMKMEKNPILNLSSEQVNNIADRSTGMSLAELESIIELAIRNAIRTQNNLVGDEAFDEAFETICSGEEKKWDAKELESTARHEAGHALICWMTGEKPSYLTIVARGDHGGYMRHANSEQKGSYSKKELLGMIRTSLAGRAAEIVYYGAEDGITTGASSDLAHATGLAESMIADWGMDDKTGIACVKRDSAGAQYARIHDRVNEILEEELANAIRIICDQKVALDKLVEKLLEKNQLKENEIDEILSQYIHR